MEQARHRKTQTIWDHLCVESKSVELLPEADRKAEEISNGKQRDLSCNEIEMSSDILLHSRMAAKIIMQAVINWRYLLGYGWGLDVHITFALSSWMPSSLDLWRPWACCHSLCQFSCSLKALFPWYHPYPLALTV